MLLPNPAKENQIPCAVNQYMKLQCVYRRLKLGFRVYTEKFLIYTCVQREYEEFKVRVNALVAKAQKVPEEGWTMEDGTPWPGNNTRDHPGMIQVSCTLII